ncbi:unnamed protein product [Pedinophyceae sp. YPF-701]|nr:unnamed protein product [Pedinophyceae sp. YPF-701]
MSRSEAEGPEPGDSVRSAQQQADVEAKRAKQREKNRRYKERKAARLAQEREAASQGTPNASGRGNDPGAVVPGQAGSATSTPRVALLPLKARGHSESGPEPQGTGGVAKSKAQEASGLQATPDASRRGGNITAEDQKGLASDARRAEMTLRQPPMDPLDGREPQQWTGDVSEEVVANWRNNEDCFCWHPCPEGAIDRSRWVDVYWDMDNVALPRCGSPHDQFKVLLKVFGQGFPKRCKLHVFVSDINFQRDYSSNRRTEIRKFCPGVSVQLCLGKSFGKNEVCDTQLKDAFDRMLSRLNSKGNVVVLISGDADFHQQLIDAKLAGSLVYVLLPSKQLGRSNGKLTSAHNKDLAKEAHWVQYYDNFMLWHLARAKGGHGNLSSVDVASHEVPVDSSDARDSPTARRSDAGASSDGSAADEEGATEGEGEASKRNASTLEMGTPGEGASGRGSPGSPVRGGRAKALPVDADDGMTPVRVGGGCFGCRKGRRRQQVVPRAMEAM